MIKTDNEKKYYEEKASYYCVITEEVMRDKRLNPLARLLYAKITNLSNARGFCWASNSYFADYFEVSVSSIKTYISQLKKFEYIYVSLENNERKIYVGNNFQVIKELLTEDKNQKNIDKKVAKGSQNIDRGSELSTSYQQVINKGGQNSGQGADRILARGGQNIVQETDNIDKLSKDGQNSGQGGSEFWLGVDRILATNNTSNNTNNSVCVGSCTSTPSAYDNLITETNAHSSEFEDENYTRQSLNDKLISLCQQFGDYENVEDIDFTSQAISNSTESQSQALSTEDKKNELKQNTELDYNDVHSIANYHDWNFERLTTCCLVWIQKLTAKLYASLELAIKPIELERLRNNFENRTRNCGVAFCYAIDDAMSSNAKFRMRDFINSLNIYFSDEAKVSSRASEGNKKRLKLKKLEF